MSAPRVRLQTGESKIDGLRELQGRIARLTEEVGKGLYRVRIDGRNRLVTEDEIEFQEVFNPHGAE